MRNALISLLSPVVAFILLLNRMYKSAPVAQDKHNSPNVALINSSLLNLLSPRYITDPESSSVRRTVKSPIQLTYNGYKPNSSGLRIRVSIGVNMTELPRSSAVVSEYHTEARAGRDIFDFFVTLTCKAVFLAFWGFLYILCRKNHYI